MMSLKRNHDSLGAGGDKFLFPPVVLYVSHATVYMTRVPQKLVAKDAKGSV